MKEQIQDNNFRETPKDLLITCAQANTQTGSSTFVIASLSENSQQLNYAFIGDSSKESNIRSYGYQTQNKRKKRRISN